jgi:hypothetical protein
MARTKGAKSNGGEMALRRHEAETRKLRAKALGFDPEWLEGRLHSIFSEISLRNQTQPAAARAGKLRQAREAFQAALMATDNHLEWEEAARRAAEES